MSENFVDTSSAGSGTGATASAPVESVPQQTHQNVQVSEAPSSAETVKTDTQEHMIPKSRFDQVNTQLKALKEKEARYGYVEQFEKTLEQDPDLAAEIKAAFEKRKQRSQPVETQKSENRSQQVDPVVQGLAKEVFLMKAKENVGNYNSQFNQLAEQNNIPAEVRELYRHQYEQNVLARINGDLSVHNPDAALQAFQDTKQYLDRFVTQRTQPQVTPNAPVLKPNAPITANRPKNAQERMAFIASGIKASRGG